MLAAKNGLAEWILLIYMQKEGEDLGPVQTLSSAHVLNLTHELSTAAYISLICSSSFDT